MSLHLCALFFSLCLLLLTAVESSEVAGILLSDAECFSLCGAGEVSELEESHRWSNYPSPPLNAVLPPVNTQTEAVCSNKGFNWAVNAQILLRVLGIESNGSMCTDHSAWNWAQSMNAADRKEAMRFLSYLTKFRFRAQHHDFDKCFVTSVAGFFDPATSNGSRTFSGNVIYRKDRSRTIELSKSRDSLPFRYVVLDAVGKVRSFELPTNKNGGCMSSDCDIAKRVFAMNYCKNSPANSPRCVKHTQFTTHFFSNESLLGHPFVYPALFSPHNLSDFSSYERALAELQQLEDGVSTVREDVTASNLAILSLPLLMSLPPISLFDVSDKLVMWWVLATDVLAALPLLIKGIELVVRVSSEQTAVNANSRQWYANETSLGRPVTLFETYFVQCDEVKNDILGVTLIVIAIWLILASCLCEYLVWRRSRFISELEASENEQKRLLRSTRDDEDPLPHFKWDERPSCLRSIIQFLIRELWVGRLKWDTFLALTYLIAGPLSNLFVVRIYNEPELINYVLGIHSIISTLVLFVFHLCSSRTTVRHLLLVCGVLMGLIFGPLYIVITRFTGLRYSERWYHVTKGSNLGFTWMLILSWYVVPDFFVLILEDSTFWHVRVNTPTWPVSSAMYCVCVLLIGSIRRNDTRRSQWRVCSLSFATGVLFGPFFVLFRSCFPEGRSDKGLKTCVRRAGWAGLIVFISVVLFSIGVATNLICFRMCFHYPNGPFERFRLWFWAM